MNRANLPGDLPLRPELRGHLYRIADPDDPRYGLVVDELRQCPAPLRLPRQEYQWLQWFDGEHNLGDIQQAARRHQGGEVPPLERFLRLADKLDDALLLEGPRWQERITAPIREPACIGCYDGDAEILAGDIQGLFTMDGGPGLPRFAAPWRRAQGGADSAH